VTRSEIIFDGNTMGTQQHKYKQILVRDLIYSVMFCCVSLFVSHFKKKKATDCSFKMK